MPRPVGLAPGSAALALAWAGGAVVAQLTGATPVVIVLAAGLAAAVVAAVSGWWRARRVVFGEIQLPPGSTVGEPVRLGFRRARPPAGRRVWVDVFVDCQPVASGWLGESLEARFARRGEIDSVDVTCRVAGALGLVWWQRAMRVPTGPHVVAPQARTGTITVERRLTARDGDRAGRFGAIAGETDGVRPWREGDSERSVHWASTLRAGELVVHDRRQPVDRRSVVRATPGAPDPDAEAGAALAALSAALAAGEEVWAAVGTGEPVPIVDAAAARRWAATAPLGEPAASPARAARRPLAWLRRRTEPETTARVDSRWWAAAATLVALLMMAGSLGYRPLVHLLAAAGVGLGAAVSARRVETGGELGAGVRTLVAGGALVSIAAIAAAAGPLDGLLAVLRGPLPQLLIMLIVLHGFECRDRRTIRVGLAISAVVVMYAAAFRVDRTLVVWLVAWAGCTAVALMLLADPPARRTGASSRTPDARGGDRPAVAVLANCAATGVLTLALLAVVPVPDGPARVTLPTFIDNEVAVGQPGALAGPDGALRLPGDTGGEDRSRNVSATDYTGFAEALDTNVRGDLSDEVVLRVRASEPDFWRGQTFSQFDGRVWHADRHRGEPLGRAHVDVPPAFGDPQRGLGRYALRPDEFTQTFFVERDLPNVLFHAYQADEVVVDAEVWARPDGALRASSVLPAGSVYTVVSDRRPVTAEWLRKSGMVGERLNPAGLDAFSRYLAVPASTTVETRDLADRLARGLDSTYDVVRAYEAWIDANITYDLDAPLPDAGEDAVHELLFGSRRGFCEQIASALVVMLRTQGVPARLATGYAPGRRDAVAGVWEVRASDAHAWAEVWFPEVGWQAFDPTAGVPLAGDTSASTIGAGMLNSAIDWGSENPGRVVVVVTAALAMGAAWRLITELVRRHRRGRWGVLQDRFAAAAARAGARIGASNTERASAWASADDQALAREVARRLDAAAFDPAWSSTDDDYADTHKLVENLR